ncbi:MAG: TonB-dependent receptor [Caulobacteraceae bacterium]|nr:TonB-dependent receptor [Caulobacteraceae bacterium]
MSEVEEVIVTASKTGEDLREVAGSVSSVSGQDLSDLGAQGMGDYLAVVPGARFNEQQPGFSTITIRGVNTTTNFANISQGTTGSYVNDIPLTDAYFTSGTPDIDAFDVRNVEVYRGPQGTLFGASSLGGAVNFIANPANVDGFDLGLEATVSSTSSAGDPNGALRVMVNAPVSEGRFAIRGVGSYRREAGFIDNTGLGRTDVNDTEVYGGRLGATLVLGPETTVSWLTLYQSTQTDDVGYENPDLHQYTKSTGIPELAETNILIHSLRLDHDLPFAHFTGLVSYRDKESSVALDLGRFSAFGFVNAGVQDDVDSTGLTFEARLADQEGSFRWVVGLMHDEADIDITENVFADNAFAVAEILLGPGGGALATDGDIWGLTLGKFSGQETAVFGEARYLFNDQIEAIVGGRLFRIESDFDSYGFGLLYAAFINGLIVSDPPTAHQAEDGFSPKLALSYRFAPDAQIYASMTKGFRFGGVNVNPDPSLPRTYDSDSTWNYELGLRGRWLDRRLTLDASLFKIDWSDIQLPVVTAGGTQGIVNAGDAEIYGGELAFEWSLTPNLSWQSSITYLDAELTSVDSGPGLIFNVSAGSGLPGASDWSVSNVIRYEWQGDHQPYVQLSHRYASTAPALLQQFPLREPEVGGYNVFDLRAGVTINGVEVIGFVNNLTDERAVTTATYTGNFGDTQNDFIMRPRTFGLTLRWKR